MTNAFAESMLSPDAVVSTWANATLMKSLAFSPKGDTLFSGGGYGEQQEQDQVKRWDVAKRKELPW